MALSKITAVRIGKWSGLEANQLRSVEVESGARNRKLINVANVAKTPKTTDATAKTESGTPPNGRPEPCSWRSGNTRTTIALFLEEVIIREDGALCSFHYLFDRYRKWRASYGLLATQLDQAQFAAEMQFHGVSTNFERKLAYAPPRRMRSATQALENGER
jgi:hypothetical protein